MTRIEKIEQRCNAATPIDGFPGYYVSSDGIVFSTQDWRGKRFRELTQYPNTYGYMRVRLTNESVRVSKFVHKLVADAYLTKKPSDDYQICHINGNKNDNRAVNLRWGTAKDNAKDREDHGKTARGIRNGFSKLTENDVAEIKKMIMQKEAQWKIAKKFGVSQSAISRIATKEQWKHVR